jgi:predicted ATPase
MLRRSDAVELFIDRARSAGTDLDLDHDQLETIAEICGRLDGIPLPSSLPGRGQKSWDQRNSSGSGAV